MMIQLRSICLSAHLDEFCQALNSLSAGQFEFVYLTDNPGAMRRCIGWGGEVSYSAAKNSSEAEVRAVGCDLLIEMNREMSIMEHRARIGKRTVYISERWFKPLLVFGIRLPGVLRLLSPAYFRMAYRFVRLMDSGELLILPIGVHAAHDFVKLHCLMHGRVLSCFSVPEVEIERKLFGRISGFPMMRLWSYFVPNAKSTASVTNADAGLLRVLWIGRLIPCKRVDVLIKAFLRIANRRRAALLLVGTGPQLGPLRRLAGDRAAGGLEWIEGKVCFNGEYVDNEKARSIMRAASVFVFCSNAEDGWGAVVSEALAEGCPVVGTCETGAAATLLKNEYLYQCDSIENLERILLSDMSKDTGYDSREWSGERAASLLMDEISNWRRK